MWVVEVDVDVDVDVGGGCGCGCIVPEVTPQDVRSSADDVAHWGD